MVSFITTHVLDAAAGRPAAGIAVELSHREEGVWSQVAAGVTDADGRIADLGPEALESGTYRLTFNTGDWFVAQQVPAFYPEVVLTFDIDGNQKHYHVPVLLSPFAYSTYRGS